MAFFASIKRGFTKSFTFFAESYAELKKVRWPSRKELTSYTLVVFITIVLVTLYFWLLEIGISPLVNKLLES